MANTEYDKIEDGSFVGRIPKCKGVIAFAETLRECADELHSTLEDWILVGLKLGHRLPVMMLKEVESIIGRKITIEEWNTL